MYSRSFRPAQKRTEGDIPIQYFGDSFSPDAFKSKQNSSQLKEEHAKDDTAQEMIEQNPGDKTIAPTKAARKYDIEDMVLVGLLLLFATDIKDKDDIIIPVILAAILLF